MVPAVGAPSSVCHARAARRRLREENVSRSARGLVDSETVVPLVGTWRRTTPSRVVADPIVARVPVGVAMFGPKNRGNGTVERRFPVRPPSGRSSRGDPKDAARNGTSTPTTRKLAVDDTKLRANLASCKYEAVRLCTTEHGYEEVGDEEEYWDLNWTDLSVSEHRVAKMHPFQRINHFPGMMEICRKASLSRNLKRMQQACPEGTYDFSPTTWEYPHELESFRRHCRGNPGGTYIVKPTAGAMGRGIYLIRKPEDIDHKHERDVVIQKYVANPFLVDGYKFDLRVYALVTCVDPLTVYVYDEGIARFATLKYEAPGRGNLREKTMHLTNYSVNKHSDTFEHADADDEGTKRTLTALMRDLETRGHDVEKLRREISDVVVRTIVPIQPHLAHVYHSAVTNGPKSGAPGSGNERGERGAAVARSSSSSYADLYAGDVIVPRSASSDRGGGGEARDSRCFEILGFDIILDDALRPTLLEVNHSPSFGIDSPLDRRIKTGMIGDVLAALRLDASERNAWLKAEKKRQRERLYNGGATGKSSTAAGSTARSSALRSTLRGGYSGTMGGGDDAEEASALAGMEALRSRSRGNSARGGRPGSGRSGTLARPSAAEPGSRRDRTGYGHGYGHGHPASAGASASGASVGSRSNSRPGSAGSDAEFRVRDEEKRRPPGTMNPSDPPLRLGGFQRVHPHAGPTAAEAAASRAHGMAASRVTAHEALMRELQEAAESFFQPVAGCACASCDARNTREQLGYAIQHMKRVTVEGDDAPLDVRDDEFLSSFPFSTETPKNFAVRVGGDAAGGGAPAHTRTYTSLAAKASLNPRNTLTRTYR